MSVKKTNDNKQPTNNSPSDDILNICVDGTKGNIVLFTYN
jgi:hypothetical protein